jgi:hypothetical protein
MSIKSFAMEPWKVFKQKSDNEKNINPCLTNPFGEDSKYIPWLSISHEVRSCLLRVEIKEAIISFSSDNEEKKRLRAEVKECEEAIIEYYEKKGLAL